MNISDDNFYIRNTPLEYVVLFSYENKTAVASLTFMCNTWYFNRLFAHPSLRGKGIASKLVDTVIQWAHENDHDIICDINPYGDLNFEQLKKFYIKHGFKDAGDFVYYGSLEAIKRNYL